LLRFRRRYLLRKSSRLSSLELEASLLDVDSSRDALGLLLPGVFVLLRRARFTDALVGAALLSMSWSSLFAMVAKSYAMISYKNEYAGKSVVCAVMYLRKINIQTRKSRDDY
jgi:hypothetical protein